MGDLDHTHDARIQTWVASATPGCDFPLQNLPLGIFRPAHDASAPWRVGTAIGAHVLDLGGCAEDGLLDDADPAALHALDADTLNGLMALPGTTVTSLRHAVHALLRADTGHRRATERRLHAMEAVTLRLPVRIGNYTDFYASLHHATNTGRLLRPDSPLMANYPWLPVAYHGRPSSVVVSGTPVRRPWGQQRTSSGVPELRPSGKLDLELEVGLFVGAGNPLGEPIPIAEAADHLFGCCLLNDWSARDIQAWEYQPLGPFLGKNFATTISPWVVTRQALLPFRTAPAPREPGLPAPLPYLSDVREATTGAFDIHLEWQLRTTRMREGGDAAVTVARTNLGSLLWTPAQLIAHHTVNGCNLEPGDLLGSGTVSGPDATACGSMLELTKGGREPWTLPNGETRGFLEDGDEVVLRGRCSAPGAASIGFGECHGRISPAR